MALVSRPDQAARQPLTKGSSTNKYEFSEEKRWERIVMNDLENVQFGVLQGGFHFTTQMSIVPVARPFPPCSGDECQRLV